MPRGARPTALVRVFHPRERRLRLARRFERGDALLFGAETRGLPDAVLEACPVERRLRIPMLAGVRSLNLSNAVAVAVYEAWRQQGFVSQSPP